MQLHYVYTLTHTYTHLHTHVHAMGNCQLTCVAKWQAQHIHIRSRTRIGTSFQQVVALSPLSDIVPYNLSYVDRPTVRALALVSMVSYDMCSSIRYFACVASSAAHTVLRTEDYVAGFSSFRFFRPASLHLPHLPLVGCRDALQVWPLLVATFASIPWHWQLLL